MKTKAIKTTPRALHATNKIVSASDFKGNAPTTTQLARQQTARVNARRLERELVSSLRGTSPQPQQYPDQIGAVLGPYLLS